MSPLCEHVWIHHRKFDEAGLSWCVPDALGYFDVIIRFGEEDIRYVALRVAVVQWKQAGLHLHHDAVSSEERMVDIWEVETVQQRLIRRHWGWILEAGAVAATEDAE